MKGMNIQELQDRLQGVYDFTKVADCHAVISMLLRDLHIERSRNVKNKPDMMNFLKMMTNNTTQAENMSDKQLYNAAMQVWGGYSMETPESCFLGELLRRFKDRKHVGNKVSKVR